MGCYAIDPHRPPHSTAHYERLFRSCRQRYQGDAPTGLLLVYPQHCVHLMEAPWDVLRTVVQDLEEMESKGYAGLVLTCLQWMNFHSLPPYSGFLKDSKLLNFDSNIDQRLYPQWAYRVLNLPTLTKGESYKTQEPIEQTVCSLYRPHLIVELLYWCTSIQVATCLESLYKLGVHLSKLQQVRHIRMESIMIGLELLYLHTISSTN